MIALETELAIGAPPEKVWAVLTDFPAYQEWNPFVTSAAGPLVKGGRLSIRVRLPEGPPLRFDPTITVLEPGSMLAWKGRFPLPGLFAGVHYFRLTPIGASGTLFTHGERFDGLIVKLMGETRVRTLKPAYEAMNRALAARCGA
jgi:hypothetical protein